VHTRMPSGTTRQEVTLSPSRRALVNMIRDVRFGRIEGLVVQGGEPVLDPPPRTVQTVRFGAAEVCTPTPDLLGIASRPAVRELLSHMDRIRDGKFLRIEVREGSPCFCEVEIATAANGGSRG
jgi:hypothetical protein